MEHAVFLIDPIKHSWKTIKGPIQTDGIHKRGALPDKSKEADSETIKVLKAETLKKIVEKLSIDQALIFCRTKLDCDNLHAYFKKLDCKLHTE